MPIPNTSRGQITTWPVMIDLITSALMIFILVGFLQAALNLEDLEAMALRERQQGFLALFEGEFEEEIDEGTIAVERSVDFIQLSFSDRVLFASGNHLLQRSGQRLLERCARVLEQAIGGRLEQIQVEGHTDDRVLDRPIYPRDNWELSTARALSVVRFLIATDLLPEGAFSANGYGPNRPVASNGSTEGRARNRRIEMRIFFATGGDAGLAMTEEGSR